MQGKMLWFNEQKEHGFILTDEGERLLRPSRRFSRREKFPLDAVRIWSFSSRSSRRTDKEWRRGSLRSRRTRHRARAEERQPGRVVTRRWTNLASNGRGRLLVGEREGRLRRRPTRDSRACPRSKRRKAVRSARHFPIRSLDGRLDGLIVTGRGDETRLSYPAHLSSRPELPIEQLVDRRVHGFLKRLSRVADELHVRLRLEHLHEVIEARPRPRARRGARTARSR